MFSNRETTIRSKENVTGIDLPDELLYIEGPLRTPPLRPRQPHIPTQPSRYQQPPQITPFNHRNIGNTQTNPEWSEADHTLSTGYLLPVIQPLTISDESGPPISGEGPLSTKLHEVPTEVAPLSTTITPLFIEELLQCPICFEVCEPPIFQCCEGHTICCKCEPQVKKVCPSCRGKLPRRPIRNRTLESIFDSTRFFCKYRENGCREVLKGVDYNQHVGRCPDRPFYCNMVNPVCKCAPYRVIKEPVFQHYLMDHSLPIYKSGQYCTHDMDIFNYLGQSNRNETFAQATCPMACWEFNGCLFLERMAFLNGKLAFDLVVLEKRVDPNMYEAEIQLIRKGMDCAPNIRKAMVSIPIRSVAEPDGEGGKKGLTFYVDEFMTAVARMDQTISWISRIDLKKRL